MDNINQILQSLEAQLLHRLEKLWRVFSWSSTILTSIITGIIVLKKIKNISFAIADVCIASAVVIIFTSYAWLMINENLKFEMKIRDQIDRLLAEELHYPAFRELRPDRTLFGYKQVILLLGLTALATIWIDFL